MQILITLYLLFVVPVLAGAILIMGAFIYRAGQTNASPIPPLPHIPRFKVSIPTNGQRDEEDRLPEV